MQYFKVNPKYDNIPKAKVRGNGDIYIANELYTEREVTKQRLNRAFLLPVNVLPKNTYWMFGARFEV